MDSHHLKSLSADIHSTSEQLRSLIERTDKFIRDREKLDSEFNKLSEKYNDLNSNHDKKDVETEAFLQSLSSQLDITHDKMNRLEEEYEAQALRQIRIISPDIIKIRQKFDEQKIDDVKAFESYDHLSNRFKTFLHLFEGNVNTLTKDLRSQSLEGIITANIKLRDITNNQALAALKLLSTKLHGLIKPMDVKANEFLRIAKDEFIAKAKTDPVRKKLVQDHQLKNPDSKLDDKLIGILKKDSDSIIKLKISSYEAIKVNQQFFQGLLNEIYNLESKTDLQKLEHIAFQLNQMKETRDAKDTKDPKDTKFVDNTFTKSLDILVNDISSLKDLPTVVAKFNPIDMSKHKREDSSSAFNTRVMMESIRLTPPGSKGSLNPPTSTAGSVSPRKSLNLKPNKPQVVIDLDLKTSEGQMVAAIRGFIVDMQQIIKDTLFDIAKDATFNFSSASDKALAKEIMKLFDSDEKFNDQKKLNDIQKLLDGKDITRENYNSALVFIESIKQKLPKENTKSPIKNKSLGVALGQIKSKVEELMLHISLEDTIARKRTESGNAPIKISVTAPSTASTSAASVSPRKNNP